MMKYLHEIRDPIHGFVRVSTDERRILDSRPVQRLRNVHQLALTYLVYPGATHRRFEHVLGVMELAGRAFDVLTDPSHVSDPVRDVLPEVSDEPSKLGWYRTMVRLGGLCHDLGHLPFSHAAEHLLPEGKAHEDMSVALIQCDEMKELWGQAQPPYSGDLIAKIAVGAKHLNQEFSNWEGILTEVVTGDALGVDRMDYLLRDAHHAGVTYGHFEHLRLVDSLRLVQPAYPNAEGLAEPAIGIEEGALPAAEGLLVARHFMFSSVYYHPIRQAYNRHLEDFLKEFLEGGKFSDDPEKHMALTDVEVIAAMRLAARDENAPGHDAARRIIDREHFKLVYDSLPEQTEIFQEAGEVISKKLDEVLGEENVKHVKDSKGVGGTEFPVLRRNKEVASSHAMSEVLKNLPAVKTDRVFVAPDKVEVARAWLRDQNINELLEQAAVAEAAEEEAVEG